MPRPHPRPLYLMTKPPRAAAERPAADVRTTRATDLLHITLMMLGDRREVSDFRLHQLIDALDHVPLPRFRVTFDSIHESARTVGLRGSQRNEGLCDFQAALRRGLIRQGIAVPGYKFHPHITLAYRRDGQGSEAIDPISWLVDEFRLIESVHGEGRHIEHGHFALMPPPFVLADAVWSRSRSGRQRPSGILPAASPVAQRQRQRQLALF